MNKQNWVIAHGADLAMVIFILFLALVPAFFGQYNTDTVLRIMINAILVVSFRLIGTSGLWSFAHTGFMCIGAYTGTLLITKTGVPFWAALPVAVVVAAIVAYILSYALLRTRSFMFFLASSAIAQSIVWFWVLYTGTWSGITSPRPTPLFFLPGVSFETVLPMYYLVFGLTVISLFIMYRIEKSKIGDTIKAVASNEMLSKSIGINAGKYQRLAFVIGSTFAALAGVLWATYTGSADPNAFSMNLNMQIMIWTIVGGSQAFAGPLIGLVLMTYIGDILSKHLLQYLPLVYGGVFIGVILTLKGGLLRLFEIIWKKVSNIVKRNHNAGRPVSGKDNA